MHNMLSLVLIRFRGVTINKNIVFWTGILTVFLPVWWTCTCTCICNYTYNMINRKKRAERRKEHYEKSMADPTQFLQVGLETRTSQTCGSVAID